MQGPKKFTGLISEGKSSEKSQEEQEKYPVIIGDGGMGTELMKSRAGDFDTPLEFNLKRPAEVRKVHRRYLNAGSQIINTNTFCANRLYLQKQELADREKEINLRGSGLAEEARADFYAENGNGKEILITGSVGPTGSREAIFPDRNDNRDLIKEVFTRQIKYLKEGGVDIIALETFSYHRELELAARAAEDANMPFFACMTFSDPETTDYGTTVSDFAEVISRFSDNNLLAAGLNCIAPASEYRATWKNLSQKLPAGFPMMILYNAGEPQLDTDSGSVNYPQSEEFFSEVKAFSKLRSSRPCIIGGCCGTDPDTIRRLNKMLV